MVWGDRTLKKIKVFHYDAFSQHPNKGNPAGVVLDTDQLSDHDMQSIAKEVGFNETVFVVESKAADLRLRYFTPGHEINLCGHATMAAVYCLKESGRLDKIDLINIETNIGILPIELSYGKENQIQIRMKQDNPKFIHFNGDRERLANSIGLEAIDLEEKMPIVYGSTGTWTLLIPIKNVESFRKMQPSNTLFPHILTELPKASLHPFCLQAFEPQLLMHARHFSSPFSGTIEDPVTGTASGVMGAYYLNYVNQNISKINFNVEQGQEIGRDGTVNVEVYRKDHAHMDVYISGTAVYVQDLQIEYA